MEDKYDAARNAAATYRDIFGKDNFFLEIQDQGLEKEHRIHPDLFRLEKELGIPLVATNDSHYLCEDDAHAQDVMLCIQTGKSINDTNRMKFHGNQFFVKTHDEMQRVFRTRPTCSDAHAGHRRALQPASWKRSAIRSRSSMSRPATRSTATSSTSRARASRGAWKLCARCEAQGRLKHTLAEYEQRLEREIAIIQQMKFSGYFLIVWDFIRYASEHDIPVGPGRGSAAGSWSPTPWGSPTSIRCSTSCCSSAS